MLQTLWNLSREYTVSDMLLSGSYVGSIRAPFLFKGKLVSVIVEENIYQLAHSL